MVGHPAGNAFGEGEVERVTGRAVVGTVCELETPAQFVSHIQLSNTFVFLPPDKLLLVVRDDPGAAALRAFGPLAAYAKSFNGPKTFQP